MPNFAVYGVADYPAYCVAVLIFLMLPGPGTLALLTSTSKGGFRAGAAATMGLVLGDQVLLWLAVMGVAALLQSMPWAFKGIQWAGAAYLAWVGLQLIMRKPGAAPVIRMEARRYAMQAFFITLLNPKAIVFYMAFFPLFVNPAQHRGWVTFAVMAVTIAAITVIYCLSLCHFAQRLAQTFGVHQAWARHLERLAGVLLIAFGWRLTLQ